MAESLLDSLSRSTSKSVNKSKLSSTSSTSPQTPFSTHPLLMAALEYHNCNFESLVFSYSVSRSSANLRIISSLPCLPLMKSNLFVPNACPSSTWKQLLVKLTYSSGSTSNHVNIFTPPSMAKAFKGQENFP